LSKLITIGRVGRRKRKRMLALSVMHLHTGENVFALACRQSATVSVSIAP